MSKACQLLHERLWELPRRRWEKVPTFDQVPINGVYAIFERGEVAHGGDRIVRVGTHRGEGRLVKRLAEHAYPPFRSIMRRHLGKCILARAGSDRIADYGLPITSRADKEKNWEKRQHQELRDLEPDIDHYIRKNLSYVGFEVGSYAERKAVETAMLSTVAQCDDCGPSKLWLGGHFPPTMRKRFATTGLWNIVGLRNTPMSLTEVRRMKL